jgi:hypothetical protein
MDDGILDPAWVMRMVSLAPGNMDFALQNVASTAITNAAVTGAFTCTVAVAAYTNALVQYLIQRLQQIGYTATLSGTTLTISWSTM